MIMKVIISSAILVLLYFSTYVSPRILVPADHQQTEKMPSNFFVPAVFSGPAAMRRQPFDDRLPDNGPFSSMGPIVGDHHGHQEPAADYYDAVQLEGMEMDGERSERKKGDERGSPPSSSSFFDALRANVEPLSSVLFGGSRVFPTPNSEAAKKLRKRPVVDGSTAAGGQPLVVDDFTGTATYVRNPLNGSKTKPEQQRQQHTPKSEAAVVDGQTGLGQEEEDNEMSNQKTNVTQKDNNAIPPNLPPIANRFMPRP